MKHSSNPQMTADIFVALVVAFALGALITLDATERFAEPCVPMVEK